MQILDILLREWVGNVPSMQRARNQASCVYSAVNNKLVSQSEHMTYCKPHNFRNPFNFLKRDFRILGRCEFIYVI